METGKTGRYFKYAIGEIVLVVIGILIALQINNWNEIKKGRAFEVKMLTEVKTALINDKAHFQKMIKRNAVADSTATLFIDLIDQNVVFNDTMYSALSGLRKGTLYQYNRGPYEAIKSSGIDKISNDSLRNKLINFYDFEFPRHKELTLWDDSDYDQHLKTLAAFKNGKPYIKLNSKNRKRVYEDFPDDLLSNPKFLLLLKEISDRARSVNSMLTYFQDDIQDMITQIDTELKQ
jgi:hypothetical protein